jgi:CPA2 family monovalent cation:H+ antiporter-2
MILIIKPTAAFVISMIFKKPILVSSTVALGLAQIGEFSFILAEVARKLHIFSNEGYDVIVACALASICINPLLFKLLSRYHARQ